MKRLSLANVLGLLALLTFAATRLIGLAQYPIYFFTDEAANTVLTASPGTNVYAQTTHSLDGSPGFYLLHTRYVSGSDAPGA